MSFIDLDSLNGQMLITHFVLEHRRQGHVLPYDDNQLISTWLKAAASPDELLLVLSELLPKHYGDSTGGPTRPLRFLHRKVMKKIKEMALRRTPETF